MRKSSNMTSYDEKRMKNNGEYKTVKVGNQVGVGNK